MNNITIFNSPEFGNIRTEVINEEVWFVGKDVTDILGYQNGSRDINRHVDEEDRHKVMLFDGKPSLSMSQVFTALSFQASLNLQRDSNTG